MSQSPVVMDTYARVMVDSFDMNNVIGVSKGFQSFYGNPVNGGKTVFAPDAEVFEHDVMNGSEKRAALIPRGINGTLQSAKGATGLAFTSIARVFPMSEIVSEITSTQINKRLPNESQRNPFTRNQRKQILAKKLHVDHVRSTARLFETLAAQAFFTGKQDAILGTTKASEQYDFLRHVDMTLDVAAAQWVPAATTIFANIDEMGARIRARGRMTADGAIVDGATMEAMLNNAEFQKLADNRRFIDIVQLGGVQNVPPRYARLLANGFFCRGKLLTPGGLELWLFQYTDGYDNDSGVFTKYVPDSQFTMFVSSARYDRYFGPPEINEGPRRERFYQEEFGFSPAALPAMAAPDASQIIMPQMFYFDAFSTSDEKGISLRTQSAPVFAPVHPNTVGRIINTI